MLKFMRKHATSWFIKIALGLIIVVFIFWGVGGFRGDEGAVVAKVGDTIIDVKSYRDAYQKMVEYYRKQYKGQWSPQLLKVLDVKHRVLNQLIDQVLIAQEAKRLHITVSKKELEESIESMPVFRRNGHFSRRLYLDLLRYNRIEPADFESSKMRELLFDKVKNLVADPASFVTEEEVNQLISLQYEKRRMAYVKIAAKDFMDHVEITDADLKKYYEAHKEKYREPEKVSVVYLLFEPKDYTDKVKVSEEEVKKYYETFQEAYRVPERIRARHILFKVSPNAKKEEVEKVKSEAEKVLKLAKSGEDFAKLAEKYSQGPTAKKGGDLGYFTRGMMVKPFEEAAFALKKGEISGLVRTSFGFHIIKLEDKQPAHVKPFEEVKKEIETKLKLQKAKDIALKEADKAYTFLYKKPDILAYAKEHGIKVHKTGLFSKEEKKVPEVIPETAFTKAAFGLQKGKVSSIVELKRGFCLMTLLDHQASQILPLDKVKEKVTEAVKKEKAGELARKKAEALIEALKKGETLAALAEKEGLKVKKTKLLSMMNPYDPDLGGALAGAINEIALLTKKEPIVTRPLALGDLGYAVCVLDEVVPPTQKEIEKSKKDIRKRLREVKSQKAFQSWLNSLRKKAKIEIRQKVLDSFS
ncbi:MAG: SurA N-terminal domain-containing protein [Deltaproteobacteria bacterium]|nr:SurA N-terminal domain-containing protein [Deltaproteobacteria bacterium]